jgi:hypothetical protein
MVRIAVTLAPTLFEEPSVVGGLDELAGQLGRAREHHLVAARHIDHLAVA